MTFFAVLLVYINIGDKMKKIIKGIVVPVLAAIIVGYVFGKYVFLKYKDNLYSELSSSRLYLVENGEYDTIDKMREDNSRNSYIYYLDDNKYKSVVGITRRYDNIDKIKKLYNDNVMVMEYYIEDDIINSKQEEYDNELMQVNDIEKIKEVVDNILELYREDDGIKLIEVS